MKKILSILFFGIIFLGSYSNVLAAPIISEVTPVSTPTGDPTPDYIFTTDEAGTITYGGNCDSVTTSAILGNNTIIFDVLADGIYSDCTITITDTSSNVSNILTVSAFEINQSLVSSSDFIYNLDFESEGWESAFRSGAWEDKVSRVTDNPHGGSYSLRGNLMEVAGVDPITGLGGINNPLLEFVGNDISSQTPDMIFIRYWRRLDDSNWSGSLTGYGKGEYLTDDDVSTTAYYTRNSGGYNDYAISGNGAYSQEQEAIDWGYLKANLSGPEVGGPDGQWTKFEFFVDYRNPNFKYVQMWVNDQLLTAEGSAVGNIIDGKVRVDDSFHLRGLQLLYVADEQVESSTDGTGYACGYQYDDFEVWNGMPNINYYRLNYNAGVNGNITGITSQLVEEGFDGSEIIAVPDSGYSFVNWSDGNESNIRTDVNIISDSNIIANFEAESVDTTPDAFTFTDVTDATLSTLSTSDAITVTGINTDATISIIGNSGEYELNNTGTWTSTSGTVSLNDTVKVRQTSSGSYSTETITTLDIGGVTDDFNVTTEAEPVSLDEPDDSDNEDASIGNKIWYDENEDGIQDFNESGIEDIRVKLIWEGEDDEFGTDDDEVWRTDTNDKGRYEFGDLFEGKYRVIIKEEDLTEWIQTYDPSKSKNMNNQLTLKLREGRNYTKADFGYTKIIKENLTLESGEELNYFEQDVNLERIEKDAVEIIQDTESNFAEKTEELEENIDDKDIIKIEDKVKNYNGVETEELDGKEEDNNYFKIAIGFLILTITFFVYRKSV